MKTQTTYQMKGGNRNMRKTAKKLCLSALLGASLVGCTEDKVVETSTVDGKDFENSVALIAYHEQYNPNVKFNVYGGSRWRNYPTCGALKPLPRAEVTKYASGREIIDLYFPKK